MIEYGLSKDVDSGKWQETHLFDHLQVIIGKNCEYSEDNPPQTELNN